MSLRRNYTRGYIGFSSTYYYSGVYDLNEVSYLTPTVIATSQADGSTDLTLPTGISAGNTIIIVAGSRSAISTPSGYTLLNSYSGAQPQMSTFYKIADGSESGTTITNLLPEDRKSTRLNSSHIPLSRMPSSA